MPRSLPALFTLLLLPAMAFADDLYLLRADYPGQRQGIVRFDMTTMVESPFAEFIYLAGHDAFGGLDLVAHEDRVVAQGSAFYEFDINSGNLLRRYPALAWPYDSWAFHGVPIAAPLAERLGIPPGYYGKPSCPPGPFNGEACNVPEIPFPGYTSQTNLSEQHVFLRRGLEPQDTSLSIAKLFAPSPPGASPFAGRLVALDAERHRFWFLVRSTRADGVSWEELTTAAITTAGIGDETLVQSYRPAAVGRSTGALRYDERTDTFLNIFAYHNGENRLLRTSHTGAEETLLVVDRATADLGSLTPPATELPAIYEQLLSVIGETPGANDTYWRSDAWFFNPSSGPMTVTLKRVSNSAGTRTFTLEPYSSHRITNIMRELGGGASGDGIWTDALLIEAPYRAGAQLSVYSRTYTTDVNGGTYGQAVPAVPTSVGYSNHVTSTTVLASIAETPSVFAELRRRLAGADFRWREAPYEYETVRLPIDILAGNAWLREGVDAGCSVPVVAVAS